nr:hypothetical protein [Nostoc sp. ChiQUE02]MDZ8234698.1 hypothetical protein [Nostoc sp. ChiQUE02]
MSFPVVQEVAVVPNQASEEPQDPTFQPAALIMLDSNIMAGVSSMMNML